MSIASGFVKFCESKIPGLLLLAAFVYWGFIYVPRISNERASEQLRIDSLKSAKVTYLKHSIEQIDSLDMADIQELLRQGPAAPGLQARLSRKFIRIELEKQLEALRRK